MRLEMAAYAKINLTLHITGKRDDGYHTLDTIMQSISLADTVTLALNDSGIVSVGCSDPELAGEENLAHKAALTFLKALGETAKGVDVYIHKQIPMAAGLGGGSADGAAVLAGLNHLFNQPFSLDELQTLALPLGADVPFCLVGGTCLATGIGEVLQPLPTCSEGCVLLIKPCDKGSTGEMYRKYDKNKGLSPVENCAIIDGVGNNDIVAVAQNLYNDFQPLYEGQAVRDALTALKAAGALGASLSGSGPTVFGVFPDNASVCKAKAALSSRYSDCIVADFTAHGWAVI